MGVLIRLSAKRENQNGAVGRPIDGMLVVVALHELTYFLRSDVYHEDMQALIVVEAREAFAIIGLVEIACDDSRVTAGFGGAVVSCRRDEGDLFSIGRPCHVRVRIREGRIGAR